MDEVKLTRAPLALVACQVRYETQLSVSGAPVAKTIRDALGGHVAYPGLEQLVGQQSVVVAGPGMQTPAMASSSPLSGWRFTSPDGTWIVTVMPDFAGIETTAYERWTGSFGSRLEQVLRAVSETVTPIFEQRLGIRFINELTGLEVVAADDWARILSPALAGPLLHPVYGAGVTSAQQLVTLQLDEAAGILASLRHGLAGAADGEGRGYLLDIDVSRQGGRTFDVDDIVQSAFIFRGYANTLFQSSLTTQYFASLA